MVEYTSVMSPRDIEAKGYRDTGYVEQGSKTIIDLIMQATVNNKCDLVIRTLDAEGKLFQTFQRGKYL